VIDDIQPDRHSSTKKNADKTAGRANYLYADAHVESHQGIKMYDMFDNGRGIDFSAPPEMRKPPRGR
jgi:prepilin-type processing-associated H-X9-DG protein